MGAMVGKDMFKDNVNEWIKIVNLLLKELNNKVDDVVVAQDNDLSTLVYQYKIIKDLRERIEKLEYDDAIKNQIIMALKNKL